MTSIRQWRHCWMKQWHRPACCNNSHAMRMTTAKSPSIATSITAMLLPPAAAAVRWSSSSSSSSSHSSSSSSSTATTTSSSQRRPDPFARRPTAKCDPYGQGGKPLTLAEATNLLATVDPQWKLWKDDYTDGGDDDTASSNNNDTNDMDDTTAIDTTTIMIPFALCRDFWHADYLQGAEFVQHVAAVAETNMNNHYPYQVSLERYLGGSSGSGSNKRGGWKIRTRVVCRTLVLQGLSHHDFFLATLLDVECGRPELQKLFMID